MFFMAMTYGNSFLFRTSLGPIADAIALDYGVTATGVAFLSSAYWIAYISAQIPWGLYLQVYTCQSSVIISCFASCVCCFLFPFTSGSLLWGSIIFFLNGIVTGNALTVGLIFAGQRFGSKYMALCGGIVLISGTAHNFIGGVIQAHLYEKYQVWKPVYWALSALMFCYGVIFTVCVLFDAKQQGAERKLSFRKQTSVLSNVSEAELANMDLSVFAQLKKNMAQTVRMYLNWLLALTMFCAGVVFMGVMSLWLVPYLMVKFDYSRSVAALVSGLAFISSGIGSIVIGIISKKVTRRKPFVFCGNTLFLAFVAFIYLDASMMPLPFVIFLCIVTGVAFSHFSPFVFTICREYNWFYGNTETAVSFVNMGLVLSGAVGQFTIGELLDIHYEGRADAELAEDGNRIYTVEDFNFALIIVPVCLCIMLVSECLLKETFSKNLEYEPKEDKKQPPKMQKVKTTDMLDEVDVENEGSGKDSYNSNPNSAEMTSLNNESAEDEDEDINENGLR